MTLQRLWKSLGNVRSHQKILPGWISSQNYFYKIFLLLLSFPKDQLPEQFEWRVDMIIQLPFINPGFKDIYNTAGNDTLPTNSFCLGKYSWPLSHTSFDAWTSQVRCVHCPSSQKSLCNFAVGFPYLQFLIWGFNQPPTVMKHLVFKRFFKKDPHSWNLCCSSVTCMLIV